MVLSALQSHVLHLMSETKFVHFALIDPFNKCEVGPRMGELHVVIYCYGLKPTALIEFFSCIHLKKELNPLA